MAETWEVALDLDDSDFSSLRPFKHHKSQQFLHPCTLSQNPQNLLSQPHPSASPVLIPGPAGTVQSSMLRRRSNQTDGNFTGDFGEQPIPTQEYVRRAVENGQAEDDDDFSGDPWLYALDFVRSQGFTLADDAIGIPLSVVKKRNSIDKVEQVVAIVKSCTPNGFGDMKVTLKDPTGTIDASVHRGVFMKGEFGKDIPVGSVIIVKKVAVFSPSRGANYLNITLSNVVKVISKDSKLSQRPICAAAPAAKHAAPVSEYNEISWMPEKKLSLSEGRTEGILNCLKQNANKRRNEQMENENTARQSCRGDGNNETQNFAAGNEHVLENPNRVNDTMEVAYATQRDNNNEGMVCERLLNPLSQAGRGNILEGGQCGSAATSSSNMLNDQETGNIDGSKWRKQPSSRVSVPHWTDEQLDKLFDMD